MPGVFDLLPSPTRRVRASGQTLLDDPRYASVFQRRHELKVPLYVHPFVPLPAVQQAYNSGPPPEVTAQFSLSGWSWHHEAGIHVLRLILSGVLRRFLT
jgi:uncharacterized protein